MRKILGFIGNFLVSMFFAFDVMDYYFHTGTNVL